jgi:hypothetical protein
VPFLQGLHPLGRVFTGPDARQGQGNAPKGPSCVRPGMQGQVGAHVALDVDQATLDAGVRPGVCQGRRQPGAAVNDHDPRRRELLQQGHPRNLLFAVAPLPADGFAVGNRDQATPPAAQVDAVHLDLQVDLAGGRQGRLNGPTPPGVVPEGPARAGVVGGLGLLPQDPLARPGASDQGVSSHCWPRSQHTSSAGFPRWSCHCVSGQIRILHKASIFQNHSRLMAQRYKKPRPTAQALGSRPLTDTLFCLYARTEVIGSPAAPIRSPGT